MSIKSDICKKLLDKTPQDKLQYLHSVIGECQKQMAIIQSALNTPFANVVDEISETESTVE